jgi:hypothetical protein
VTATASSLSKRATSNRTAAQAVRRANGFCTEEQLISTIRTTFAQHNSATWQWIDEFNSPSGIADLVAVSLRRDWKQQASMRQIPVRWLYPLTMLPLGVAIDVKAFANRFGVSESSAHGALAAYVDSNYCTFNPDERVWTKTREPSPVAQRIVALEAKLRDWRRALYQAVQYASYAFEVWVVLDTAFLHPALIHADEFEKRGIGLLGLSANGQSELVTTAIRRPPRNHERFWQANAEIVRRLPI